MSHALSRYRQHHPKATSVDMFTALKKGEEISQELVWALTQRKGKGIKGETYLLAPDKAGIFVISVDGWLVTYLRLADVTQNILNTSSVPDPPLKPEIGVVTAPQKPKIGVAAAPLHPLDELKNRLRDLLNIYGPIKIIFSSSLPRKVFNRHLPRIVEDPHPRANPGTVHWGGFIFVWCGDGNIRVSRI